MRECITNYHHTTDLFGGTYEDTLLNDIDSEWTYEDTLISDINPDNCGNTPKYLTIIMSLAKILK